MSTTRTCAPSTSISTTPSSNAWTPKCVRRSPTRRSPTRRCRVPSLAAARATVRRARVETAARAVAGALEVDLAAALPLAVVAAAAGTRARAAASRAGAASHAGVPPAPRANRVVATQRMPLAAAIRPAIAAVGVATAVEGVVARVVAVAEVPAATTAGRAPLIDRERRGAGQPVAVACSWLAGPREAASVSWSTSLRPSPLASSGSRNVSSHSTLRGALRKR